MRIRLSVLLALSLLFALVFPWICWAAGSMPDYKIAGPFKSHNLEVFIIHGADSMKGQQFLTLAEAMQQKALKVFETGEVNELACQNFSSLPVFIQSGDIVKGGRQDRTMQYDLIVPPNSKRMPLSSFCVEHGRWQQRGAESAETFSSSAKSISGKELKLAAKYKADQVAVWDSVSLSQSKLAMVVPAAPAMHDMRTGYASPTSFQLTMENKELEKSTNTYAKDLQTLASKDKDAIGYAFSIDGKLNSADVYASHDLFVKLWPKLLESTAVEAVAQKPSAGRVNAASAKPAQMEDVRNLLTSGDKGKSTLKKVSDGTNQVTRDSANAVYFETQTNDNAWLHRNYITK